MASEDDLIDEYVAQASKAPKKTERIRYLVVAILTVSVPIYLYLTIFDLPLEGQNLAIYGIVSLLSAFILHFSYHNNAFALKNKLVVQRESSLTSASVADEAQSTGANKKDLLKKKKDEVIAISSTEAQAYSILSNNVLFLLTTIVLAFFVFGSIDSKINYILSVSLAAGLVSFVSSSQLKS